MEISDSPGHDELQALVAGIAGLAIERGDWQFCRAAGTPPHFTGGVWCEGFIVKPEGCPVSQASDPVKRLEPLI